LSAVSTTRSSGTATLRHPRKVWGAGGYRDGMPHLTHEEFLAWLSEQRQEFEDDVDRRVQEWWQRRGRLL